MASAFAITERGSGGMKELDQKYLDVHKLVHDAEDINKMLYKLAIALKEVEV